MKIVILGSTGMLGWALGKYFGDKAILSYKDRNLAYGRNTFFFDATVNVSYLRDIPKCDYLINCVGIIKPFSEQYIPNTILINSILPHKLACYCEDRDIKMINITTDCCYQGLKGNYIETDPHDCIDIYGKTKSLGEPKNCMNIRTSVIGEELHNKVSLLEWARSNKDKEVNGFTNHFWNGITTTQYAKICDKIIKEDLYDWDTFHVFSETVTKYKLLHLINNRYDLNLKIKEVESPVSINRTLSTIKDLNSRLDIPPLTNQL